MDTPHCDIYLANCDTLIGHSSSQVGRKWKKDRYINYNLGRNPIVKSPSVELVGEDALS